MIALSVIALAFLVVLGTVVYGMVLAAAGALAALVSDIRDSWSARRSSTAHLTSTEETSLHGVPGADRSLPGPEMSTEEMWQRMQGTSRRARRRGAGS